MNVKVMWKNTIYPLKIDLKKILMHCLSVINMTGYDKVGKAEEKGKAKRNS